MRTSDANLGRLRYRTQEVNPAGTRGTIGRCVEVGLSARPSNDRRRDSGITRLQPYPPAGLVRFTFVSHTSVDRTEEDPMADKRERVSMDEIEAEDAIALPNKEVMSLLDVNANVDLGLDLAAPVDLAAAANLNVAAPIEAAASANILSPDATAVSEAYQHGSLDQSISGSAEATAPQHAVVAQGSGTGGSAAAAGTSGADAAH